MNPLLQYNTQESFVHFPIHGFKLPDVKSSPSKANTFHQCRSLVTLAWDEAPSMEGGFRILEDVFLLG